MNTEIQRLQAELLKKKMEMESLRQEQPVWDDDDDEYEEESYYEEEIIEEYDDDEWEEEIIEEEVIEEEVIEDDPPAPVPAAQQQPITTPAYSTSVKPISSSSVPIPPSPIPASVAVPPPAAPKAVAASPTPTPPPAVVSQQQPAAPAPAAPAPVVRRWGRPVTTTTPAASTTPAEPAAPAAKTGPLWAFRQQSKVKKTPVPTITSSLTQASTTPPPAAATATPVSVSLTVPKTTPPVPSPAAVSTTTTTTSSTSASIHSKLASKPKPKPRVRAPIRPPPGASGQQVTKNKAPPGLEMDIKKGPTTKVVNWGANRRTNEEIQTAVQPNFRKGGGTGGSGDGGRQPVQRNFVVPEPTQRPPLVTRASVYGPGGLYKRRHIPDIPVSEPGHETLWETLLGPKLIANSKLQKRNTIACMDGIELIGLYFGCSMKSECKFFHPRLQAFYLAASKLGKKIEIVYISSDRTRDEFRDLFAKMPYMALPGGTAKLKNYLSQSLKIIDQPTLVILDDEGMVVTVDAAKQVIELERGNDEQVEQLIDRWMKTRPVSMEQVQRDYALQHGKLQRGVLYWQE